MMSAPYGSKYWCELNIRERRRRQWRRCLVWSAVALAVAPPLVALFFL
jgi:hypothetical protein